MTPFTVALICAPYAIAITAIAFVLDRIFAKRSHR